VPLTPGSAQGPRWRECLEKLVDPQALLAYDSDSIFRLQAVGAVMTGRTGFIDHD